MKLRSALVAMVLLVAPAALAGYGDDSSRAATPETARLAAVNAAHLCEVRQTTLRTEDEIGDVLHELLADEGLDHDDWRAWRDSLPDAPERVAQLFEVTESGC